ncbi:PiT family inorganic phosphate transporter [Xylogone sp. PMI_703]|nr:PiT family inorganic phosphate transporter [Xylogone sp. PMI_703]
MIAKDITIEEAPSSNIVKSKGVKQLPVTLLSGFLGSGKTTLLEHILKSPDHGLPIAVIVNDMSTLNIDASLISQHVVSNSKEKLIQLQNGCICCTLRGDLLEELVRLARTDSVQYVIIESTGISEPMQVAETFTAEFTEAMIEQGGLDDGQDGNAIMKEIADIGGLHKLSRLDTTVTVVDAFNFFTNFSTSDFLTDRWGKDAVTEEDERTISDLLVDQIEFADVIIVNKVDCVDAQTKTRILAICKKLNPSAKVIEASYSRIDVREIVQTGMFSFEKAATGAGWLRSLHELTQREIGGVMKVAPKPETEEYGISSFVYRARRPFHPKRLFALIHDKFIVLQNVEQDEDGDEGGGDGDEVEDTEMGEEQEQIDDNDDDEKYGKSELEDEYNEMDFEKEIPTDERLENKRKHPAFSSMLRSKGFFWLATRPQQHGEWSQAGGILTLQGGAPWFSVIDRAHWPDDPAIVKAIEADFQEPWGDRRQEIVFIGEHINEKVVTECFDKCLLTTPEMRRWERIMRHKNLTDDEREGKLTQYFEDGFEDWSKSELNHDGDDQHAGHHH